MNTQVKMKQKKTTIADFVRKCYIKINKNKLLYSFTIYECEGRTAFRQSIQTQNLYQIYENVSYQAIDIEQLIDNSMHTTLFLEIYPRKPSRHIEVSLMFHIISHICIDRFFGAVKNCSFWLEWSYVNVLAKIYILLRLSLLLIH